MLIMQLSHLKTLIAIQKSGSFSAAAEIIHLSHSAVSIQMRQLEETTGLTLFIKGKRPAILTPMGRQFLMKSLQVMEKLEELELVGHKDDTKGSISLGFVPTTLSTVLPIVLGELRNRFPELHVSVRSGPSNELASDVAAQKLDFAFITAPHVPQKGLHLNLIADEAYAIISNVQNPLPRNPYDLFLTQPFIAFSRSSWMGHQIESYLAQAGVPFDPTMELDSIDAVENLVALGHGVSVVPIRTFAPQHQKLHYSIMSGDPAPLRQLTLATHAQSTRATLRDVITQIVQETIDA
jgi:DNA-binding transcriptional LysR family regulator